MTIQKNKTFSSCYNTYKIFSLNNDNVKNLGFQKVKESCIQTKRVIIFFKNKKWILYSEEMFSYLFCYIILQTYV